ncbi:SDR family oxidoreductase [Salibacter sp.]|uniref:SDR family oxidoreductase n=1 Tax=Salibacter sp. TaxID=2010995 RepID=UPI00286FBE51|nr:SDR family oxidoreductase [Salibacter sp.]MDR9486785.1 SDR family oxidoreductase [Salibacter sp.]
MKTIVITGTTSGIGRQTALKLNAEGHHVIMLNRNEQKTKELQKKLLQPAQSTFIFCDLADLKSVKSAAEKVKVGFDSLDVVLNNAGGIIPDRQTTKDGLELTFQMNHLGHFLLTNELVPLLEKGKEPRIINVSSEAHKQANPDFDDLQLENGYSSMKAYGNAKLFNIYFAQSLHEKLKDKGIAANALHPGVVDTKFGSDFKGFLKVLLKLFKPFMIKPEKGAETSIFLVTSDEGYEKSGLYWKKKKPASTASIAQNEENRERLWKESEKLVKQVLTESDAA